MKTIWLCALFTEVLVTGFSGPAFAADENGNY